MTATVVDMQRLIRECQEIIWKAQDGNKKGLIKPPVKKEKKK